MYLSYLLIKAGDNPDRPRPGRLWLRNMYRVHQRLCMGFPSADHKEQDPLFLQPYTPDRFPEDHYLADNKKSEVPEDTLKQVHSRRDSQSGFLFRIEPLPAGRAMIVIQSAIEPDWDYAFRNAGYLLAAPPKITQYDPHFENGQVLSFRLMANATHKPIGKKNRVPKPPNELEKWLTDRSLRCGFKIVEPINLRTGYISVFKGTLNNVETDSQDGGEKDDPLKRLFYASYDGKLKVSDSDSLRDAVIHGIGHGKSFGLGLLSVARGSN